MRLPKTRRGFAESDDATIRRVDGDEIDPGGALRTDSSPGPGRRNTRRWRSVGNERYCSSAGRSTFHDLQAEAERIPRQLDDIQTCGIRTFLLTPLLREGTAIGVIQYTPQGGASPLPTSRSHLLKTFASQAVIAIEKCGCSRRFGSATRNCARPGASDRNSRGARHHQPLADGRAAGP